MAMQNPEAKTILYTFCHGIQKATRECNYFFTYRCVKARSLKNTWNILMTQEKKNPQPSPQTRCRHRIQQPISVVILCLFSVLLILPACASGGEIGPVESYGVTDNMTYTWTAPFPEPDTAAMDLMLNTSVYEYPVMSASGPDGESYSQSIIIRSDAGLMHTQPGLGPVPADRIVRSTVTITNASDNLVIVPIIGNFYGEPGEPGTALPLSVIAGDYPSPLDIAGTLVPAYRTGSVIIREYDIGMSVIRGLVDTGLLSPVYVSHVPHGIVDASWDHRTGFPGTAASHSFNAIEVTTRTKCLDGNRSFSGSDSASFTHTSSISWCERDMVLGFCPAQVRTLTRTLTLTRGAIPADTPLPEAGGYPFHITDAKTDTHDRV
jgi:hypothetical protein